MSKVKCIKSLYKSTYKKNAFTKNKTYDLLKVEKETVLIIDNEGREFDFSTEKKLPYYFFENYFKYS